MPKLSMEVRQAKAIALVQAREAKAKALAEAKLAKAQALAEAKLAKAQAKSSAFKDIIDHLHSSISKLENPKLVLLRNREILQWIYGSIIWSGLLYETNKIKLMRSPCYRISSKKQPNQKRTRN